MVGYIVSEFWRPQNRFLDRNVQIYKGCSINPENNFEKNLYFRNYLVFTTAPSRYSPLSATHFINAFVIHQICIEIGFVPMFESSFCSPNCHLWRCTVAVLEVSLTCRKQKKITGREIWAVRSVKPARLA